MTTTTETFDRALVAQVVTALMRLDRATRTKAGLSNRADIARMTLNRLLDGKPVRVDTYSAVDDALLLPPGTLEAVGESDQDALTSLDIPSAALAVIQRFVDRA